MLPQFSSSLLSQVAAAGHHKHHLSGAVSVIGGASSRGGGGKSVVGTHAAVADLDAFFEPGTVTSTAHRTGGAGAGGAEASDLEEAIRSALEAADLRRR